jgi:hypothetical protein
MATMMSGRFLPLIAIGVVAACSTTDAPLSQPVVSAATSSSPSSSASAVRIAGLSNLRQTAFVVTDACRTVTYETDRRATAPAAITKALEGYASAFPGGLNVDVQPMSLRMRCHASGAGNLQSYCVADATLILIATGTTQSGQQVTVKTSKETSERAPLGLICIAAMPAVTAAVDKALAEGLVDLQSGLTAQTGVPAR